MIATVLNLPKTQTLEALSSLPRRRLGWWYRGVRYQSGPLVAGGGAVPGQRRAEQDRPFTVQREGPGSEGDRSGVWSSRA